MRRILLDCFLLYYSLSGIIVFTEGEGTGVSRGRVPGISQATPPPILLAILDYNQDSRKQTPITFFNL